jgi:outer membrane lipoprotein-sorting protein
MNGSPMAWMGWKKCSMWVLCAMSMMALGMPAVAVAEEELTAERIIDQAVHRNALGFDAGRAQVSMMVFDRAGEQRERLFDVRSKRGEERTRTLMTLTDPAEVRGQAFLFVENPEGADDMWMYVPAFDVVRRVEGSQRRASFMGSHFTFADLESRDLRESRYRRLRDETIGDHEVYVVEARPTQPQESDYSRVVAYVRKSDFIPLRVRFFNKDGDLEKTLFAEQLNTTEDGSTYIEQMTLRAEQGGYTRIQIQSLDTNVELPDSLFDRNELGR